MTPSNLLPIISRFAFPGALSECAPINTGHINATYRLRFRQADGSKRDYVLQRINTYVFKKPAEVMENVALVTKHITDALIRRGVDPENRVLRLVPASDGGYSVDAGEAGFWRAYDFIAHATTVDHVETPAQFMEIGSAFGAFQSMLADFPIEKLHDTIPFFHDTRRRLNTFEQSVAKDVMNRAKDVADEIAFVRARGAAMCEIVDMIAAGVIPLRVTHNDTKINNVMLDVDTKKAMCVIDLDTVMAGSALYDYGDAIRYGACTADEDERNLSKVSMDIELFRAFSEGFIAQTATGLTRAELENLPLGAMVMTYENGMRFLTDHLDGDVYFHINRPGQNLDRARCQFRLLEDMEAKRAEMDGIVKALIGKYRP